MNKIVWAIALLFSLINNSTLHAQSNTEKAAILNALVDNDRFIKDQKIPSDPNSPFAAEQRQSFHGLNYFTVDEKWRVQAQLIRDETTGVESLKTSDGSSVQLTRYGYIIFSFHGKSYKLRVFRDQNLAELSAHPGCLFVPFTDLNPANICYPGGRYLIINIPRDGENPDLDFNRAFNPYCVYNSKNISVLAPPENKLQIAVRAGEKSYQSTNYPKELGMTKRPKLQVSK